MSSGHIEYACTDGMHVFRLVGELRAQSALSFAAFIDYLNHIAEPAKHPNPAPLLPAPFSHHISVASVKGVLVDLNAASFLDSTILGLLAKLGASLCKSYGRQAIILSTKSDITQLAKRMGLAKFYVLLNCAGDQSCMQSLPEEQASLDDMLTTVLDAHKTLMELSLTNKSRFQPLVDQLETEVKK